MPVAVTLKLAVCPAVTDVLAGCCVIAGTVGCGVTVSVALLLLTLPAEFETITVKIAPLSEI